MREPRKINVGTYNRRSVESFSSDKLVRLSCTSNHVFADAFIETQSFKNVSFAMQLIELE